MLKSYEYLIDIDRKDIDYVNKILESYEGVGILRTSKETNIVKIFTTTFYTNELENILDKLSKIVKMKILSKKIWEGKL